MKCSIVKELLPSYRDNLTSEQTNVDIRAHLADCSACNAFYKSISEIDSEQTHTEENALGLLKKLRARIRRNRIIAALSTSVLLTGLILFATNYEFPLPFDANRMSVETFQAVFITEEDPSNENHNTLLYDLDDLDFETSKDVLSGNYPIVESARPFCKGINDVSTVSEGRTIHRGDMEVTVVYYCYYKTLWGCIFQGDLSPYSESLSFYKNSLYQSDSESGMEHSPQAIEFYYLPIRNLWENLEGLSDEAFDSMRERGNLVWSGSGVI